MRDERKLNIVCYGHSESNNENRQERLKDDQKIVSMVITEAMGIEGT